METEKTLTVREARDQLGRLLDAAHYAGTVTVITRHGEPWAVIAPLDAVRDPVAPDRPA